MTRLRVIDGPRQRTFSLGYRTQDGLTFRDSRFAPALSFREAEWLLENELKQQAIEARFRGVKSNKKEQV